jgi:hypothetical protein
MRVMSALRRALPRVQFIATTHDPLCLRGLARGEVEVLHRGPDHRIERRLDLPDVRGMSAEQLLVSDFFGLSSTADPDLQAELAASVEARQSRLLGVAAAPPTSVLPVDLVLGDTPQQQVAAAAMQKYLDKRTDGSADELDAAHKEAIDAFLELIEAPAP